VGFALWIAGDVAWAEGTHEYRPLGAAVIAVTDRFRPRDFRAGRRSPARRSRSFAGLFGSLEEVNEYLARVRQRTRDSGGRATPPWL
jgi:hypothetical protein